MGHDGRTHGVFGDVRYRSPEMLKGSSYNNKADSWAFGIILFYMLTGKHPYDKGRDQSDDSISNNSYMLTEND